MPAPVLTMESRLVRSKDQVSANLSGEAVILAMRDGVYFGVGAVGTRVWDMLTEPRRLSDVAVQVSAEYDVEPDAASADLLEFARDLVSHGLADVVTG